MLGVEIPEWVQGALICLFGSTLTALGLVLQKHSHTVLESSGDHEASYFLQKWWLFGFAVFISAQIINMVAMAMTPQTVLSCLGSWTLVCNAAFARLILGESLSSAQVVAVLGLVVAMAAVVYNAPRPGSGGSKDDAPMLAGRFLSPEVEAVTACFLGLICLLRSLAKKQPEDELGEREMLLPLSLAMMAAVSAGYTALLFKCIAEIIAGVVAGTETGSPPWYCWETYAIAAAALSCAPTELHCLNLALQSGEAIFVIPVYLTLAMMAQLTTGAVFFQEFSDFQSGSNAIGFGLGVLLTLVFVVAMAKAQDDHCKSLAEEEEEEGPFVKLASEAFEDEDDGPRPSAKSDFCVRYIPTVTEKQVVTVAGFSGAIACLESRRARGKSEFFHGLPARRRTEASDSVPPAITRLDRAATSPV